MTFEKSSKQVNVIGLTNSSKTKLESCGSKYGCDLRELKNTSSNLQLNMIQVYAITEEDERILDFAN